MVNLDEKGQKILESKGVFEIFSENQNYPKLSSTSYKFNPALFIDKKFGYADCRTKSFIFPNICTRK